MNRVILLPALLQDQEQPLIGEPGVGKTAIVEGLAQRIVRADVPDSLRDTRLVSFPQFPKPE